MLRKILGQVHNSNLEVYKTKLNEELYWTCAEIKWGCTKEFSDRNNTQEMTTSQPKKQMERYCGKRYQTGR